MTYDKATLQDWIERCVHEHTKPLSKWEWSFLESISDQMTRGRELSERQVEILERIYAEKTG